MRAAEMTISYSHPEYEELDAYRLQKDWTFEELAQAMARVGVHMSPRTLHYLVKRSKPGSHPLDRTLFKINTYLEHVRAAKRRRRPTRRASAEVRA
jgi:hypothetical protein